LVVILLFLLPAFSQDWIKTGTGLGVEKIRLAVPDFKPSNQEAKNADLLKAFNDTLWNDLDNAGIFDMVSKSFYPLASPANPADVRFDAWNTPPPNAAMLAFGNLRDRQQHDRAGLALRCEKRHFAPGARQAIYRRRDH
jgi:TolB protein